MADGKRRFFFKKPWGRKLLWLFVIAFFVFCTVLGFVYLSGLRSDTYTCSYDMFNITFHYSVNENTCFLDCYGERNVMIQNNQSGSIKKYGLSMSEFDDALLATCETKINDTTRRLLLLMAVEAIEDPGYPTLVIDYHTMEAIVDITFDKGFGHGILGAIRRNCATGDSLFSVKEGKMVKPYRAPGH